MMIQSIRYCIARSHLKQLAHFCTEKPKNDFTQQINSSNHKKGFTYFFKSLISSPYFSKMSPCSMYDKYKKKKSEKINQQKQKQQKQNSYINLKIQILALLIGTIGFLGKSVYQGILEFYHIYRQIQYTFDQLTKPLVSQQRVKQEWQNPSLWKVFDKEFDQIFDKNTKQKNAIQCIIGPESIGKTPNLLLYLEKKRAKNHHPAFFLDEKQAYNGFEYFMDHSVFKAIYNQNCQSKYSKDFFDYAFKKIYNWRYKKNFGEVRKPIILIFEINDFKFLEEKNNEQKSKKWEFIKKLHKLQTVSLQVNRNNVRVILIFNNRLNLLEMKKHFSQKWFEAITFTVNSREDFNAMFQKKKFTNKQLQELMLQNFNTMSPVHRMVKQLIKQPSYEKQKQIITYQTQKKLNEIANLIEEHLSEKPKNYQKTAKEYQQSATKYTMKVCLQQKSIDIQNLRLIKKDLESKKIFFKQKFQTKQDMKAFQKLADKNDLWQKYYPKNKNRKCHENSYTKYEQNPTI